MIYNFCSETEVNFDFDYETIYHKVVDCVLDTFNCKYDCEVSLLLVDNDAIKEINSEDKNEEVYNLLKLIGRKRGAVISGGEIDDEKTAKIILNDFRSGKLGKITLEKVNEK